jgi:hypothetical protein
LLPENETGSVATTARQSLLAVLTTFPTLSQFSAELQSAEPFIHLGGQRIGTVIAPTNEAMARFRSELGDDSYRSLTSEPSNVGTFVRHALVDQRLDRDQVVSAGGLTALDGDRLTVAAARDTITIADPGGRTARVLCGNITTRDAALFITDNALVSPTSQFSHMTPRHNLRCAPNPNTHNHAELCLDAPTRPGTAAGSRNPR